MKKSRGEIRAAILRDDPDGSQYAEVVRWSESPGIQEFANKHDLFSLLYESPKKIFDDLGLPGQRTRERVIAVFLERMTRSLPIALLGDGAAPMALALARNAAHFGRSPRFLDLLKVYEDLGGRRRVTFESTAMSLVVVDACGFRIEGDSKLWAEAQIRLESFLCSIRGTLIYLAPSEINIVHRIIMRHLDLRQVDIQEVRR